MKIDKYAAGTSMDPVQQKLREKKSKWNKKVSELIDDLIQFKKLMNGWNNKFHTEKSFIKNPIPADPSTIIGVLAADFKDLTNEANNIIKDQLLYSKTRKQKGYRNTGNDNAYHPPSNDNALASLKYDLYSEASNPFSRFKTYLNSIINPSDRSLKFKSNFLKLCKELDLKLQELDDFILKMNPESAYSAGLLCKNLLKKIDNLQNSLKIYDPYLANEELTSGINEFPEVNKITNKSNKFNKSNKSNNEIEQDKEISPELEDAKQDAMIYGTICDVPKDLIKNLKVNFINPLINGSIDNALLKKYKESLKYFNEFFKINESDFKSIFLKSKDFKDKEKKVKANVLDRFLNKAKNKYFGDKLSFFRLESSEIISECRKLIDKVMNQVQSDAKDYTNSYIDLEMIKSKLAGILEIVSNVRLITNKTDFKDSFKTMLDDQLLYNDSISKDQIDKVQKTIDNYRVRNLARKHLDSI